MTTTPAERPDHRARTPEALKALFEWFADEECPQLGAHLYQALCHGIARDRDLLAMAAHAPASQPPPNLLLGAVHDLLLAGVESPLRAWYPALAGGEARDPATAFPAFRTFCLEHRVRVEHLIETRLTQTNVIQRCSLLLPAFARVFEAGGGAPLALIEIGPSAGLNLQWDRYRYEYTAAPADEEGASAPVPTPIRWGDPDSPVAIPCSLRGERPLPPLPPAIPVAWRRGVDLNPVDRDDPDAVRWLRALIWPEHVERHARLTAAIEMARRDPPTIVRGDAASALPELIAAAPRDAHVCVYGTHTLYQFPPDALRATLRGMRDASRERDVDFLTCEGTGRRCSELEHVRYRDGGYETTLAARCNPHGRWLHWL